LNAIVCFSACRSRADFGEQIVDCPHSEQIVRTVRRADGPRALTTGLPARLMQAVLPRAPASGLRAPAAPTSCCRSDGPWDCRVQRQQWSWWPAVVACAVQHSLTVTGTDSRDDSDDGPDYFCRSWPTDYHSKESQIIMSGKIGLGRHFRHTINQNILVRFQQTLAPLDQSSR
jgi:hypothetical protein